MCVVFKTKVVSFCRLVHKNFDNAKFRPKWPIHFNDDTNATRSVDSSYVGGGFSRNLIWDP